MASLQPVSDQAAAEVQNHNALTVPGAGIIRPPSADADARATTPTPMSRDTPSIPLPASSPPCYPTSSSSQLDRTVSSQVTEEFDPSSHDALYSSIPAQLRNGTTMLKVSAKKVQRRVVRLKAEAGQVLWESKHAGMLNIENIRELRFASEARGFREQFRVAPDSEARWISIIYTSAGKYKILHLVALTFDDYQVWKGTLSTLFDQRKELMGGLDQMRKRQSVWLKQHWSNADITGDQKLDIKDVAALCRNLNISASDKAVQANFEKADTSGQGYLDFAAFQVFVKLLRRRSEVERIMHAVAGDSDSIPLDHFKGFLRKTQRTTLPEATLDAIYAKFSEPLTTQPQTSMSTRTMSMEGFTSFLMSSDNSGFSERQLRVCDDMNRPLCEYFISSSHNTYLLGGQLKGDSTSEGYIRALQQGCRSVELDVWDGPDEPLIYHGRTLTSRLPAREALTAIGKYAFIASPYPVILSMEVHCDQAQQDKLAEILRSTLGKALIDAPMFGEEVVEEHAGCPKVEALPSPEHLKYRILVKAKNLYVVKAAQKVDDPAMESGSSSSTSSDSDLKRVFNSALRKIKPNPSPPLPSPPPSTKQPGFNLGSPPGANPAPVERQQPSTSLERTASTAIGRESRGVSLSRLRSRSEASSNNDSTGSTKEKPLMSLALASLIVYTVGVKWRGLNKKEHYGASHVVSLGERRATKTIKDARTDLVAHCRNHLVRSYPAGTRFTSSNYSPLPFWAAGLQLVALNWQTYDLGTEINAAFFQRNGRSGYVLKPELLRMKKSEEKDKEALARVEKYVLTVEILSAQQLPRPRGASESDAEATKNLPMNPFIEVAVHTPTVHSSDATKYTTPIVWGNGFNPIFDSKFHAQFTVPPDMLDLAFLRLEVMVKLGGDEMSLGKYAVSLPVLMPGYRHIPLYDHLGQQYLFSSLFIYTHLQKQ